MKSKFLLPALLTATLTACAPTVAERGNLVDPDRLAKVQPGASKEDVVAALGSPTTISAFDPNYWYYMGQRTEQEAFFDPEVTDRRVIEIDFDDSDHVTAIRQYGKDNGADIEMVEDFTPPQGHQTTLAEELFGQGGLGSDKGKDKKKKDDQ